MNRRKKIPLPDSLLKRFIKHTRREPTKTVTAALGVGFLLGLLPLRTVTLGLFKVTTTLVSPALLLLGLRKACDSCHAPETESELP